MAERIQLNIEKRSEDLIILQNINLFNKNELVEIRKKRRQHENHIHNRLVNMYEYFLYIEFEINLINLILKRRKDMETPLLINIHDATRKIKEYREKYAQLISHMTEDADLEVKNIKQKINIENDKIKKNENLLKRICVVDILITKIKKNIIGLFNKCLARFYSKIDIWFIYINFCYTQHMFNDFEQAISKCLKHHMENEFIWCICLNYSFKNKKNMTYTRKLYAKAVTILPNSLYINCLYFNAEFSFLFYLLNIMKNDKENEDSETEESIDYIIYKYDNKLCKYDDNDNNDNYNNDNYNNDNNNDDIFNINETRVSIFGNINYSENDKKGKYSVEAIIFLMKFIYKNLEKCKGYQNVFIFICYNLYLLVQKNGWTKNKQLLYYEKFENIVLKYVVKAKKEDPCIYFYIFIKNILNKVKHDNVYEIKELYLNTKDKKTFLKNIEKYFSYNKIKKYIQDLCELFEKDIYLYFFCLFINNIVNDFQLVNDVLDCFKISYDGHKICGQDKTYLDYIDRELEKSRRHGTENDVSCYIQDCIKELIKKSNEKEKKKNENKKNENNILISNNNKISDDGDDDENNMDKYHERTISFYLKNPTFESLKKLEIFFNLKYNIFLCDEYKFHTINMDYVREQNENSYIFLNELCFMASVCFFENTMKLCVSEDNCIYNYNKNFKNKKIISSVFHFFFFDVVKLEKMYEQKENNTVFRSANNSTKKRNMKEDALKNKRKKSSKQNFSNFMKSFNTSYVDDDSNIYSDENVNEDKFIDKNVNENKSLDKNVNEYNLFDKYDKMNIDNAEYCKKKMDNMLNDDNNMYKVQKLNTREYFINKYLRNDINTIGFLYNQNSENENQNIFKCPEKSLLNKLSNTFNNKINIKVKENINININKNNENYNEDNLLVNNENQNLLHEFCIFDELLLQFDKKTNIFLKINILKTLLNIILYIKTLVINTDFLKQYIDEKYDNIRTEKLDTTTKKEMNEFYELYKRVFNKNIN